MTRPATGTVRKLPSGRWQARMQYPDGLRRNAPSTFVKKGDATAWCRAQEADVARGVWAPQQHAATMSVSVEDYANRWLVTRKVKGRPLADRTRAGYRDLLDRFILPTFGPGPIHLIDKAAVEDWYEEIAEDRPVYRAKAYGLLRTILASAVDDGHLVANPARIRGGGASERRHETRILEPDELAMMTAAMPPRYRALVQLSYWTGVRFGEATELRRKDLDMKRGVLTVRRAVVLADGRFIVKTPKTRAGVRSLVLPSAVLPYLEEHLREHVQPGPDALLFPSRTDPTQHLRQSALARVFYPAREAIERPDFRWHDLRHTHLTNYARYATAAETMARGGHSTAAVSLRYQHAAAGRDAAIMSQMSPADGAAQ